MFSFRWGPSEDSQAIGDLAAGEAWSGKVEESSLGAVRRALFANQAPLKGLQNPDCTA
jgi:hypothetical protein